MQTSSVGSRSLWTVLTIFALIGSVAFFVPALIIRPFSHQSERGLLWAMAIRQRAPMVSLVCAIVCVAIAAWLWDSLQRWNNAWLALPLVFVMFSAVMSRLNYFEWMFHPVTNPRFIAEANSKLDAGEMILAVAFGNEARAYPISEMAYHHIVNDEVGSAPIAVTY